MSCLKEHVKTASLTSSYSKRPIGYKLGFMQMRRVSLGKTTEANNRDMEGSLPDSPEEGRLRSPLKTESFRR